MTSSRNAPGPDVNPTAAKNDEAILKALATLENPAERKKLKLTVGSICVLTGLTTNTVRSRSWALIKLKNMKREAKNESNALSSVDSDDDVLQVPTLDALRDRLRTLLNQNALLFEEIMWLRSQVKKRDDALLALQGKRLTLL